MVGNIEYPGDEDLDPLDMEPQDDELEDEELNDDEDI